MTKCVLIVGYGSIGKRHAKNLIKLGFNPIILTNYQDDLKDALFIKSLKELKDVNKIDYCIICKPTYLHLDYLKTVYEETLCMNYLIEKPLEMDLEKSKEIYNFVRRQHLNAFVAYNLRFLKCFNLIKENLDRLVSEMNYVKIHVGQYLPEWRPNRNYRTSYSCYREKGGGVDLDLSHEIDYMIWLFGFPEKIIFKHRDNLSHLDLNSPDYFKSIFKYPHFIVDLELDYFRLKHRGLEIYGDNQELIKLDLIKKSMKIENRSLNNPLLFDVKNTYIDELLCFLGNRNINKLCTIDEAMMVQRLLFGEIFDDKK